MQPLLDGKLRSCFSMTEPTAGADPTLLKTTAVRDGEEWVLNGHKWFSSNASIADFLVVMARTGDADTHPYKSFSMFLVPTDTPGVNILRDVPTMGDPDHRTGEPGGHAEILYEDVRIPFDNLVGGENGIGQGFALAQKRLGPGRIHHAMRWLGQSKRAFDMLCERALTRYTHGSILADKQMIQDWIAESYAERQAARLLTLHAAWTMDQLHAAGKHYSDARIEIGVIKFWGAKVLYNVIDRAIQIHGSLGYTSDLPLESMYRHARAARIYDGPDEVHKVTVARQVSEELPAERPAPGARSDPPHGRDREVRRRLGGRHPERLTASECFAPGRTRSKHSDDTKHSDGITGGRRCRSPRRPSATPRPCRRRGRRTRSPRTPRPAARGRTARSGRCGFPTADTVHPSPARRSW